MFIRSQRIQISVIFKLPYRFVSHLHRLINCIPTTNVIAVISESVRLFNFFKILPIDQVLAEVIVYIGLPEECVDCRMKYGITTSQNIGKALMLITFFAIAVCKVLSC